MSRADTESHLVRGMLLRERGRYAEAADCFRNALAADPQNADALAQLAICQMQLPGQERDALGTIDRALAIEADDAGHHVIRALILCDLHRPQEGLAAAEAAQQLAPEAAGAHTARAHALSGLKRWPEAEAAARAALADDADNTFAANLLAQALQMQKKRDENAVQIQAMLARQPEDALTHSTAGWAALERGDRDAALTHFREALRIEPELEYARRGMLEAFKARSRIYRAFIRYNLFMARLQSRWQRGLLIGLFVVVFVVPSLFKGPYEIVGTGIIYTYFLFAIWTWVAHGVGNFILLFNRFTRHALKPRERLEGLAVGGSVCLGLPLFLIGIPFTDLRLTLLGIQLLSCAIPFAAAFTSPKRQGLYVYGAVGAVVLGFTAVIATGLFTTLIPDATVRSLMALRGTIILVTTLMVLFGIFRR